MQAESILPAEHAAVVARKQYPKRLARWYAIQTARQRRKPDACAMLCARLAARTRAKDLYEWSEFDVSSSPNKTQVRIRFINDAEIGLCS
jgi:hypothetical protein